MGASSLLLPLQEVYSQFQVLCLKYSQQREESLHLSVKLKNFKTGTSKRTAFWFILRLSKVKSCMLQPGLALPRLTGHRAIVFVPPPDHLLQHAVGRSTGFSIDLTVEKRSPIGSFSYISVRACSGHIPFDFLIPMNSQTSAESSV